MGEQTLGTCSICGGPVTVPMAWWGIVPPVPSCKGCGAVPSEPHGPVIPMQTQRTVTTSNIRVRTLPDGSWEVF